MLVLVAVVAWCGGVAMAADINAWQKINPALGLDAKPLDTFDDPAAPQEFYEEEVYEVTYPEGGEYDPQEYDYVPTDLPFKLPFKLDKKQVAVAMKLLKEAVKPILKSKRLREAVAYVDDTLAGYTGDVETQLYVRFILDSAQDIYEGKEGQLHSMVKGFFTDGGDEATARTIDDVWRSYVSPAMEEWVYSPMRRYIVAPVREMFYEPMSNYLGDFAERMGSFLGFYSSDELYHNQYPQYYNRWSNGINEFAKRISSMTSQARQGLEVAARVIEAQEANEFARSCGDGCEPATVEDADLAVQQ